MKSTRWVGLAALIVGAGLGSVAGCDDTSSSTGGAGGTGTSSSTGKTTSTGMVTVTSSTSSGMMGDGNDTFATATTLEADADGVFASPNMDPDVATLETPDVDVDFYKIDAKKGPMLFGVNVHPSGQGLAEGYIDSVLTIYDSNMAQIAQNDDRFPRTTTDSELFTVLPADGTYYIKVEEFCESSLAGGMCPADYYDAILYNQYVVYGIPITASAGNIPEGPEPNDTSATATTLTYAPVDMMAGSYYLSVVYGALTQGTDGSDWFKFTPPSDVSLDADQRLGIDFINPPGTINGNGSDLNVGAVQIIDSADMSVWAQLDFTNEPADPNRTDISGVPVQAGHDYFLKVPFGSKAATGQGSFYFLEHGIGGGNPVEALDAQNTNPQTPEVLQIPAMSTGYFVEGDLPAADLDHFKVATTGKPSLHVTCGAQRSGSGLRSLKAEVLKTDGTTALGSGTETATDFVSIDVDVTGNTDVVVKLSATQDAMVKSSFYRCGIFPQDTPMP